MKKQWRNIAIISLTSMFMIFMVASINFMLPVLLKTDIKETSKSNEGSFAEPLAASMSGSSDQSGDEWPMFRGALNHTGTVTTKLINGTGPSWTFNTGDSIYSSPVISVGRVYVGCDDNKTYCLDAVTGSLLWSFTTGNWVTTSPAVADGLVYVGSDNLYCLNAYTGKLAWSFNASASSPAVMSGYVYFGSQNHTIFCLNASTGTFIWSFKTGWDSVSSPAISRGLIYCGCVDNKVYCLNATTGVKMWQYNIGTTEANSPTVAYGRVYIGSFNSKIYCLDAMNGTLIWSYATGNPVLSCPAVANGRVFFSCDRVYCLNATTGEKLWNSTATSGYVEASSPAIANGFVYVGSYDHNVYCLNASTGALVWSYTTHGFLISSPAIADGLVYVGSEDGRVYCLPMKLLPSQQNPVPAIVSTILVISVIATTIALIVIFHRRVQSRGKSIWMVEIFGWKLRPHSPIKNGDHENAKIKNYTGRKLSSVGLLLASGMFMVVNAVLVMQFLFNVMSFAPGDMGNPFREMESQQFLSFGLLLVYLICLAIFALTSIPVYQKIGTPKTTLRNQSIAILLVLSFYALFFIVLVSIWLQMSDFAGWSSWFRVRFWDRKWNVLLNAMFLWLGSFPCIMISWYIDRTIVKETQWQFVKYCPVCGRELEFMNHRTCLADSKAVCDKCFISGLCRPHFDTLDIQQKKMVEKLSVVRRICGGIAYLAGNLGIVLSINLLLLQFHLYYIFIPILIAASVTWYLLGIEIKKIAINKQKEDIS